jgi:hypothetical protein
MDTFIKNFGNISISPIDKLVSAITTRIDAMVTSITEAIKAIMAQLAALGKIPPVTPEIQKLLPTQVPYKDPTMGQYGTDQFGNDLIGPTKPDTILFDSPASPTSPTIPSRHTDQYGNDSIPSSGSGAYNPQYGNPLNQTASPTIIINNYQPTDTLTSMSDAAWGARTSLDVNYTLPSVASAAVSTGVTNKLNAMRIL